MPAHSKQSPAARRTRFLRADESGAAPPVAKLPATFPEALTHILQNPNITLLPFIPEGVDIIPPIQQGLQELITTDRPVGEIMAQMGEGIAAIMKASDPAYPDKPFPEFTK